ncbi:BlaI/MecI/CopY family transcriptional regulator [Hymenobacter sp. PAMC 26628]|uniref:BlaI/MecI/CopY family transcriptional regulator n=1 Tax=Hymenobacter sp. PAMC 26628 TaxID=1484118 RepID=UPI00077050C6|nr:BlaI/MecI/CopY family transcriptional regulator [Hymenobacter sp. PAMC 26628]AMJ68354.1 transcriptional regulator [Hymenobacter sp. PAMC 26628]
MERLTQPEEDALRALWPLPGGAFVKDVLDGLPAPRPPYTTLASTLRNLERKGYVHAEKLGNSFRFSPLVSAEDYQRRSLGALVKEHFRDSYKELVSFFAKEEKISAADLQDILRLIEGGDKKAE